MKMEESKVKLLNNLNNVGAVVMIVGLFIGNFYTSANGAYASSYILTGTKIITRIWY